MIIIKMGKLFTGGPFILREGIRHLKTRKKFRSAIQIYIKKLISIYPMNGERGKRKTLITIQAENKNTVRRVTFRNLRQYK